MHTIGEEEEEDEGHCISILHMLSPDCGKTSICNLYRISTVITSVEEPPEDSTAIDASEMPHTEPSRGRGSTILSYYHWCIDSQTLPCIRELLKIIVR